MRNISDDSQINLFDFDNFKPKIELGQSFKRVDDAAKQGLIPLYDFQSPEGIPFWLLVTASEFKRRHRDDCCDLYAKKSSTILVDSAQVPVELAYLALYKNIGFCRSTKSVDDGAIIVSIGSGPGSLKQAIIDSGQAISQSQSVRRVLTARALIDYLGIGGHPFFGEQDQRSDLEVKVDERILRACARPITSTILRNKVRGKYGDEARDLYLVRTEYLIQQEKLYTWKERRVTYYCVTPPPDEPEPASAVVEAEVEVVEVAQESPGALVPIAQALTNAETLQDVLEHGVRQRFYETFQEDKNQELFEGALLACARGIGRQFEWVMFEGKKWLTVKQLASLLSLEEDSVLWWFRGCPVQEAVLTERLAGDRLKDYKNIYNPLTPLTPPDAGEYYSPASGGVEGLFDKTVHPKASHLLLFNPAGASWIALAARTEPAELIKSSFWVALAEIANVLKGQIQASGNSLQTSDPVAWEMLVNIHRDVQIVKDRLDNNVVPTTIRTEEMVNEINRNTNSPRKEFLQEAISGAIEAFLHITLKTGRDVLDQTLLIDVNGSKTKDCEFDHIRSRSDRSAQNCMPLSKATHRKKTHGQLTPEEKATLERAEKAIENYWAQKSQIEPYQPGLLLDTQL
jgi:hypothetical protein